MSSKPPRDFPTVHAPPKRPYQIPRAALRLPDAATSPAPPSTIHSAPLASTAADSTSHLRGLAMATIPDLWGYPVRTPSHACVSAINSFYRQVLEYGRDRKVILKAVEHDPACVLANALAASFLFRHVPSDARRFLSAAAAHVDGATAYEKAVFAAVSCLLAEEADHDATIRSHAELLKEFPKDLLSLKRAQVLCFYLGWPDLSLNLVEQVLPHNQGDNYIHGMLAFPLLELGRMADAEAAALKGLGIYKNDFWSQHNLCHVYQNDCRFKEAVDFMESCSPEWISCMSFMFTHNWWHVAVCYLEGHAPLEKVLKVYDDHIMEELHRDDADCVEVYLNALGLLLRVFVRDGLSNLKERLESIVEALMNKAVYHVEWLLDILAIWALSISAKDDEAGDLLGAIKLRISKMNKKPQQSLQRVTLLAEALYEFGRDNNKKVYDLLGPDFDAKDYKMVGASDEQLDVFNEVWYIVLLDTRHGCEATKQIGMKVKQREGAPFLWRLLGKAFSLEGMEADASLANNKAESLEKAYFS